MASPADLSKDRFKDVWRVVNQSSRSSQAGHNAVTWLWEFRDPLEQQSFVDFKTAQFGSRFYTYFSSALVALLLGGYWLIDMIKFPTPIAAAATAFTFCVTMPLLLVLTIIKQHNMTLPASCSYWLENLFMACCSISVGSIVFLRIGLGNCAVVFLLDFWTCPSLSLVFITMFMPMLSSKTLPSISSSWVVLCYLWSMLTIGLGLQQAGTIGAVPFLFICYAIVMLLHGIALSSELQLYLYFLRIEEMQKLRNEDMVRQAEDMRNLIGKIAHDIRTPLVAFSYGLDVMQGSMQQLEAAAPQPPPCSSSSTAAAGPFGLSSSIFKASAPEQQSSPFRCQSTDLTVLADELGAAAASSSSSSSSSSPSAAATVLWGYVQTWSAALEGLQQAHLHLMMIIDRCMDYHKLCHSLPLIPKYAPTSLSLVLEAVMNHAHKSLDSAQVKVERTDVLGYIMTDPGWLQDNLLCLISNAIRFSSPRSPVIIRVIIQEQQMIKGAAGGGDIEEGHPHHQRQQQMLRIEVEDCGVGVSEDKLPALFSPPEGSTERTQGGAGLGLYCMAERVRALQGDCGVRVKGIRSNIQQTSSRKMPSPSTKQQSQQPPVPAGQASSVQGSRLAGGSEESKQSSTSHSSQGSFGNWETQGSIFWFSIPLVTMLTGMRSSSRSRSRSSSSSNHIHPAGMGMGMGSGSNDSAHLDLRGLGVVEVDEPREDEDADLHCGSSGSSTGPKASPGIALSGSGSGSGSGSSPSRLERKVSFSSQLSMLSVKSPGKKLSPSLKASSNKERRGILRHTADPIPITTGKATATAAQIFKDMHLRVLIVDDSPLILKMLKMMFLGKGHAVVTTTNGYEALSMLRPSASSAGAGDGFDAVLVDIQMPIIDGLQMMREYRRMMLACEQEQRGSSVLPVAASPSAGTAMGSRGRSPPLIVGMSANTDHVTMQEAYAAGADHFLQKPFDIDTFYAVLLKHSRQQSNSGEGSGSRCSSFSNK